MKDPVRKFRPSRRGSFGLLLCAALVATTLSAATPAPAVEGLASPAASNWTLLKFAQGQPACTGAGFFGAVYYDRLDCGFGYVRVNGTKVTQPNRSVVKVSFVDSSGVTRETQTTTARTAEVAWQFILQPAASWAAGTVTIRVTEVDTDGPGPEPNQVGNFGETEVILNRLGASVGVAPGTYVPGDAVPVSGAIYELDQQPPLAAPQQRDTAASFFLRLVTESGEVRGPFGPHTSNALGDFNATLPSTATDGLTADASTNFQINAAIEVVQAVSNNPLTGDWSAGRAGAAPLTMNVDATSLTLHNSFVSAVGWVKPGETYPFRVLVKNFTSSDAAGAEVTIPAVDGMSFLSATPVNGGTASVSPGSITWTVGSVPARTDAGPGLKSLVVEARADPLSGPDADAQVVWKNLSTTATLTYTGGPAGLTSTSHGPKVIPPKETFDTARYGDRPFPVVPVDWFDRKHATANTGSRLGDIINSPGFDGSTFNLYQEMSYGQLFPNGTVPSAGIASRGWDYEPGFNFSQKQVQGTCTGNTFADFRDTALYPERIKDGWYQLPGDTAYYGGDKFGSALPGALGGVGLLMDIDSACGPTGKAVYDAAQAADPEIDYSDYDTDKDGVVDFFMMVFAGGGGHGESQTSVPPYDNIWPHSSTLESYYTDSATGLKGYISDDQLKDNQGRELFYVDASRSTMTTTPTAFPVFVRVGPYNVNPETSIDKASVISHEYGHSLGLPDYYSTGGRTTYGDFNLMATDKSQHMDVNAKQELGWLVPRVLEPGTTTVNDWVDSKVNTHRIDWKDASGNAYTLAGPSVNNGEAYVARLPERQIIDPALVPSGDHVWWSKAGNGFGCAPQSAHNLDIFLPELATLPAGTPVTVTFKSRWDIEWDFDYGFVMASTDGGSTYRSLPSANGYTTPQAQNPTANACQAQYGNGITGTSGSYEAGTQAVDRTVGEYPPGGFLDDQYDLSSAVGSQTVLRFSYSTDPGLTRPGWFIDDLRITAGEQVIYESDFETSGDPEDARVFNGGCKESTRVAAQCTKGWSYVAASAGSPADHAYYLEMRDRSGFDVDGKNQNDRDPIAFQPGLLLVYTDEAHCYGNAGCDDPPGQSPLDSNPQPGNATPQLADATWTEAPGDNAFSDSPPGHVDNYDDPSNDELMGSFPSEFHPWRFSYDCLSFQVTSMTGKDIDLAFNLQGDVEFTLGPGCAPYDYGYLGGDVNAPPTAVAQARPTTVTVGEEVTFDASASTDDAAGLTYEWDFGDGSTATGEVVHHAYATAGEKVATLTVTDAGGLTDEDTVTITVLDRPNLEVTSLVASQNQARQGEKVTFTANVENTGGSPAAATQTQFTLDGSTVVGTVATGEIAAGASRQVSVELTTSSMRGEHQMRATADHGGAVAESDEGDNSGVVTFRIKGNKVENGSFEQESSGGGTPAAWSGSSTQAGSATWSESGTDGSKGASMSGNGGNAALHGSPTWTSAPVAVVPGESLDLAASISTFGASSAPTVGLVYLGPLGNVLNQVTLLVAPVSTGGFETLERTVSIPAGVADVRIVLRAFAPGDVATAGTVTFDDVGLFEQ
jgi:immune inhibitor A